VEEKEIKEEHKIKKKDKKFQKEIEELKQQLKDEKEKSLRIQAEMINFRKRKEDEVANMYKYANEDILKSMLGIIDNFERALAMENEENKEFLKGFHMIYTSILKIMEENEVKEIEALDIPFDPSVHQAVMTEHVEGKEPGIVIQVLQKGYKYKERVLRPSMVKVSE
jgi:molecular chaperone GrpE